MATTKKIELPTTLARSGGARGGVVTRWAGAVAPLEVPVGEIEFSPENPRARTAEGEDLEQLKASLAAVGVLQPLTVVPVEAWMAAHPEHAFEPEPEVAWVAAAGNRRLAAARAVGLATVPVFVREDMAARQTETMLHENKVRLELSPMEEAVAFQDLIDRGMTQREIAQPLGISQGTVSKRLLLLTLPTELQAAVADGRVTLQDAMWLLANHTAEELGLIDVSLIGKSTVNQLSWRARQVLHHKKALAAAEVAAAAEQIELVTDPATRWGHAHYEHRLYAKADIEKAREAGTLAVGPAQDDTVAYYTTGKPRRAAAPGREEQMVRAAKAATKAREPWAKARARLPYTPAQLQARLLELVLSGCRVDAETQVIAMRLAEDDPPARSEVYAWVKAQQRDKKSRERLAWLYTWAALEMRSRHTWSTWSADVRSYIDQLVADGHTLSEWEQDRYDQGVKRDRTSDDSTESSPELAHDSVESSDDEEELA